MFFKKKSATRFWCTMSTHIAISGMTDWQQRLYKKRDDENNEESDQIKWLDLWRKQTSGNSLKEIYRKLCSNNLDFSDVDKVLNTLVVYVKNFLFIVPTKYIYERLNRTDS